MPPELPPATPATLSLDLSDESATTALYRAAIGPVGAAHYLPVFARFEVADRAGSGWNWAACLCTLGWMVFRRMWGAALVYVGALAVGALTGAVLIGLVFQGPLQVRLGIGVALWLVAFAVPGLWGDAWLYAHSRKRMARALADSSSWADAVALLDRQAVARPRAVWVAGVHAVVLAAALAVYFAMPDVPVPAPVSVVPQAAPKPGLAGQPVAAPSVAASPVASAPASAASALASAPAGTASGMATMSTPAPAPVPVPVLAASAAAAVPVAVASVSTPTPTPKAVSARTTATGSAAATARASAAAAIAAASAPVLAPSAPAPVAAQGRVVPSKPLPATRAGGRYFVNVGLFAVEANARKAHARLRAAGVKAQVDELQMKNGKRMRLRAGPFQTRAEATAAADTIRALGLEAQLFQQEPDAQR
jgi:cell division protein FtsN